MPTGRQRLVERTDPAPAASLRLPIGRLVTMSSFPRRRRRGPDPRPPGAAAGGHHRDPGVRLQGRHPGAGRVRPVVAGPVTGDGAGTRHRRPAKRRVSCRNDPHTWSGRRPQHRAARSGRRAGRASATTTTRGCPHKLTGQVDALAAEPDAEFVCCGIEVHYDGESHPRVLDQRHITLTDLVRDRLTELHPSTFVMRRKAVVEGFGLVEEEIPGSFGEDYEFLLRAARRHPIVNVPDGRCAGALVEPFLLHGAVADDALGDSPGCSSATPSSRTSRRARHGSPVRSRSRPQPTRTAGRVLAGHGVPSAGVRWSHARTSRSPSPAGCHRSGSCDACIPSVAGSNGR